MDEQRGFPGFVLLTDEEMDELLDSVDSKNTKNVERYARNKLERFCSLVGMDFESLHQLPTRELDNLLSLFFCSLRKDDGTLYKKKSLQSIKFGIWKMFMAKEIDISSSKEFHKFNNMYKAVLKQVKTDGKGTVKHKPPVNNNDMRKIRESGLVDPESPIGLQNKVFLDVMVYFGQRGRESLRAMTPDDYILRTDSKGKRYFEMKDSLTKN